MSLRSNIRRALLRGASFESGARERSCRFRRDKGRASRRIPFFYIPAARQSGYFTVSPPPPPPSSHPFTAPFINELVLLIALLTESFAPSSQPTLEYFLRIVGRNVMDDTDSRILLLAWGLIITVISRSSNGYRWGCTLSVGEVQTLGFMNLWITDVSRRFGHWRSRKRREREIGARRTPRMFYVENTETRTSG